MVISDSAGEHGTIELIVRASAVTSGSDNGLQTFSSVQFSRTSITGAQTAEFPSKVCIHGGT